MAWDATLDERAVVMSASEAFRDELRRNRALLQDQVPPQGLHLDNTSLPQLRREARKILHAAVLGGAGFAVLRGSDLADHSQVEMQNIFWRICTEMGAPRTQKRGDVRFGRVADLGLPSSARPRYHETGIGGSIHTDSPIMPQVADIVGLLCLNAAARGGESKFVSIARVHDMLLEHAEDLLRELYEPFWFDRRIPPAQCSPQNPALLKAPIFTYDPALGVRGLRLRWQPEYVWEAADLPGASPLSERQRLALHLLEGVLEDRSGRLTVRIAMRPGDMQFLNNHAVAHGRTAFTDTPADADAAGLPPSRREMRRVWLGGHR